jgi:hypothetical protein
MGNLYSKARSLVKSLWKWAWAGFEFSEVASERFDICRACSHKVKSNCSLCGCYLHAKVRMMTEECPIRKW